MKPSELSQANLRVETVEHDNYIEGESQVWLENDGTSAEIAGRIMEPDFAQLFATSPKLLKSLIGMLELITSGRHYETQNPYTRPEVMEALETIKEATRFQGRWVDATDQFKEENDEISS